ncbi:MAG: hypothetical protein IJR28_02640 [Ottowia sp.]|nr:hypothetical protein [Ottowia sp.]
MKYIKADEWDLSVLTPARLHDLREDGRPVCLVTELECSGEKTALLNILAPAGHVFWNFSGGYTACSKGQVKYISYIASRAAWRQRLLDINELCNPGGDEFYSFGLLFGLTQAFYEEFGGQLFVDYLTHASIAVPAEALESMKSYYDLQLEYFADDAFAPDIVGKPQVQGRRAEYERLFRTRLAEVSAMPEEYAVSIRSYTIGMADFMRADLSVPSFGLPAEGSKVSEGLAADILKARAEWVIKNLPLRFIQSSKTELNGQRSGAPRYARLRNELRQMFDVHLARFPIIQTNPYENARYSFPPQ